MSGTISDPRLQALYVSLTECVIGSSEAAKLLMTGLLAGGHVLIRGGPGLGKTSLAKALAQSLRCSFSRIQFTPDLLPADIIGYNVYDQESGTFVFHPGAVFGQVILADEINRASPRVQSALLECMEEAQVSVDGTTYALEQPFFVVATENHLHSAGTYPLPDSQLDRFLLSFDLRRPGVETQLQILEQHTRGDPLLAVKPLLSRNDVLELQRNVQSVFVDRKILEYIVALCENATGHKGLVAGPSSRAQIGLLQAARAYAALHSRDAVYPDDVKKTMPNVLRHRLPVRSGSGATYDRAAQILDAVLAETAVPTGAW